MIAVCRSRRYDAEQRVPRGIDDAQGRRELPARIDIVSRGQIIIAVAAVEPHLVRPARPEDALHNVAVPSVHDRRLCIRKAASQKEMLVRSQGESCGIAVIDLEQALNGHRAGVDDGDGSLRVAAIYRGHRDIEPPGDRGPHRLVDAARGTRGIEEGDVAYALFEHRIESHPRQTAMSLARD